MIGFGVTELRSVTRLNSMGRDECEGFVVDELSVCNAMLFIGVYLW